MAERPGVAPLPSPLPRHRLVTIAPAAWPCLLQGHAHEHLPLLQSWAARGWPAIIRRPLPEDAPGLLPIGVPLPPSAQKLRIALCAAPEDVTAEEPLPALAAAMAAAPAAWQKRIAALLAVGEKHLLTPRVFGSLCWQARTGLAYLGAGSDLDLVWPVAEQTAIAALAGDISNAEQIPGPRLDGELVFVDGRAVNWREFFQALRSGAEVLVKDAQGAALLPLGALPGVVCPA